MASATRHEYMILITGGRHLPTAPLCFNVHRPRLGAKDSRETRCSSRVTVPRSHALNRRRPNGWNLKRDRARSGAAFRTGNPLSAPL